MVEVQITFVASANERQNWNTSSIRDVLASGFAMCPKLSKKSKAEMISSGV
jgi:hypothetical protein